MNFFIDEQLPVSLAAWLRQKGHVASHVRDIGLKSSPDLDISHEVASVSGVFVTKDSDFLQLRLRRTDFQIVWVRLGNIGTPLLLVRLEEVWESVIGALEAGEPVVEVR